MAWHCRYSALYANTVAINAEGDVQGTECTHSAQEQNNRPKAHSDRQRILVDKKLVEKALVAFVV